MTELDDLKQKNAELKKQLAKYGLHTAESIKFLQKENRELHEIIEKMENETLSTEEKFKQFLRPAEKIIDSLRAENEYLRKQNAMMEAAEANNE